MSRLKLREGWLTFLLLGASVLTVTGAIQRADWTDDLAILTPITFGGLLLGLALAKWRRLPSLLSHLLAIVIGALFIIMQMRAVPNLLPLARENQSYLGAVRFLLERARVWYFATGTDQYSDDFYLFVFGIAALMWLVSYLSVWMVFRARWIWPALLLPAIVLLINLGYAPSSVSSYLILFVICGLLLVARFHVAERKESWRAGGVAFPDSLGWRALWIGIVVVVLTVGFGWGAPFAVSGQPLETAWNRVNGPWVRLESAFNSRFGSLRGAGARGIGNFASFGDRFRLGGPLKLSQNPVLVLQADQPYYLKARTYDTFDGQGWSTNVDSTFVHSSDGRQYAPQVDLPANQPLSIPALQGVEQKELTIRMLASKGNGFFTADQFVGSNQRTYVVMSWTQYRNQAIDLEKVQVNDLPPDLRNIYTLVTKVAGPLRNTDDQGNIERLPTPTPVATPTGRRGTGTVTPIPTVIPVIPTPAPYERTIEEERSSLAARLINVRVVGEVWGGDAPDRQRPVAELWRCRGRGPLRDPGARRDLHHGDQHHQRPRARSARGERQLPRLGHAALSPTARLDDRSDAPAGERFAEWAGSLRRGGDDSELAPRQHHLQREYQLPARR